MVIGFSGSKEGLDPYQLVLLKNYLTNINNITKALHGGCVGADEQFHDICLELGIPLEVHFGYSSKNKIKNHKYRANLNGPFTHKPFETFFARNRTIADRSDIVFTGPNSVLNKRGGTWHTWKYSNNTLKQPTIMLPPLFCKEVREAKACPYCWGKTTFDNKRKKYRCTSCKASVGVHKGTRQSFGSVATETTRYYRNKAHKYFDYLWLYAVHHQGREPSEARTAAYTWLAKELGIPKDFCHMGMFNEYYCKRVVDICRPYRAHVKSLEKAKI